MGDPHVADYCVNKGNTPKCANYSGPHLADSGEYLKNPKRRYSFLKC